jgi:heme/copper-type cytochrome/quinol oxidase subunit 2
VTDLQIPKRHFPVVGLLGLVVIAAAGGGIYYYQFIVSHSIATYTPSHRLVFMNATIVEVSPNGHGFEITNTAFLNQTNLPGFTAANGVNMTGVKYTDYKGESDNSTIDAHPGDTITFYIYSQSVSDPSQLESVGHGFQITSPTNQLLVAPTTLNFGQWYTFTATFSSAGTYVYRCTYFCSNGHPNMFGNIIVS